MTRLPNEPPARPVDEAGAEVAAEPDYSQRLTYSYLVGVYLAVNAVSDIYLLVEGPDCVHMKTQFVQGSHDWLSTLTSVSGYHRIANTALHPAHMPHSREQAIADALGKMARHAAVPAVLLTSMPMASITGADYQRICGDVQEAAGKPVVHLPGKSLSGDWLDGYAETQLALARRVEPPAEKAPPDHVAVVGNLFDRHEEDHRANARELRRLLGEIGLTPVSIWFEGQTFAELAAVARAGTIISLPYGRRAAQRVARRTGARLVETELPFGLAATERWVRQLGRELGREREAEALVARELGEVVPRLEWVTPFMFQGRRAAFVGDPHLVRGFREIVELLGAHLACVVITNCPAHAGELAQQMGDTPLLVWPRDKTFGRFLREHHRAEPIGILVANNAGVMMASEVPTLEFGFPSYYSHSLYDRPFLGFRGFVAFVDSLANTIRLCELTRASARLAGPGA